MKRSTIYGFGLCTIFLTFLAPLGAQEVKETAKEEVKVVKHTLIERYEPEMILSAEDRAQLKLERLALIQKRQRIIDTLNISERRKRSLLRELYRSPHSYKWDKLIADLEFEIDDGYR